MDFCQEGIPKKLEEEYHEEYPNICKIPLESLFSSVTLNEDLINHLYKPFKPCESVPTPYLCDLKAESTPPNGMYSRLNKHKLDDFIVCVDKKYVYQNEQGETIEEDPHVYYIDGKCDNLISSTGFVHAFFPEFASDEIAQRTVEGKTFQTKCNQKSYKYYGCKTAKDIQNHWNNLAKLGTKLHANIENYINGDYTEVVEENKIPFQQFLDFHSDKDFWHWDNYRVEWPVYDKSIRLAGKIDYVGITKNGKLIIIDWKRVEEVTDCSFGSWQGKKEYGFGVCDSLENCKLITYSLQVNTYKWIIEKNYGFKVENMFLAQFHPNNKDIVLTKCPNLQKYVALMAASRLKALQMKAV